MRNKKDEASNVLFNINQFSSSRELWVVALVGIVLQFGVLVHSDLITNHPSLMFQKGGQPIGGYAYPCTAIGTLLLVVGLLVCSHVVESSTRDDSYQPKACGAQIVYLQQAGTFVIATSCRNRIDAVLKVKTVLPTSKPSGLRGTVCWVEVDALVGHDRAASHDNSYDSFESNYASGPVKYTKGREAASWLRAGLADYQAWL